jgi:hypothetical protein
VSWKSLKHGSEAEPGWRRPGLGQQIAMGASISQKKGWVITRKAFDRMLAEPHPDSERAGD